ncbi:MAG TPA: chloride channel protein EriC, partial [Cupriavidus sp.]|nr:chloride channel protein EriC [Cupriavidus sp.]
MPPAASVIIPRCQRSRIDAMTDSAEPPDSSNSSGPSDPAKGTPPSGAGKPPDSQSTPHPDRPDRLSKLRFHARSTA